MTETTLRPPSPHTFPRLSRFIWAPAIILILLGVLATGFLLGKYLIVVEPDVVELPPRAVQSIARLPEPLPAFGIQAASAGPRLNLDPSGKADLGLPAPEFTVQTSDGKTVRLSDFKGQPVLLNFWATWCAPCLIEMPALEQTYRKYQSQGLVVLAVNQAESADKVTRFMQTQGLTFPAVLDTDLAIGRLYRVTGYPTTWLVDREGNLRQMRRGAFGNAGQIEQLLSTVISSQ